MPQRNNKGGRGEEKGEGKRQTRLSSAEIRGERHGGKDLPRLGGGGRSLESFQEQQEGRWGLDKVPKAEWLGGPGDPSNGFAFFL